MTKMPLSILAVSTCLWLSGCSTESVHFDQMTPERVRSAYERILHPQPGFPYNAVGSPGVLELGLVLLCVDTVLTAYADHMGRLLGIWSKSSEHHWNNGRYSLSNSTWWLIVPVKIESETAIVQKTATGTKFTLEVYPPNRALIEKRISQLRKNLDLKQAYCDGANTCSGGR
ncbi:MAG: hypothetical protein WCK05_11860, partial [Planctomycetota bacterium]